MLFRRLHNCSLIFDDFRHIRPPLRILWLILSVSALSVLLLPNGVSSVSWAQQLPTRNLCLHLITDLLQNPVSLVEIPSTAQVYIAERDGSIQVVDVGEHRPSTPELALDISEKVMSKGDHMGILGMALHPRFRSNGFIYIMYSADTDDKEFHHRQMISRFTLLSINGTEIDKFSELIILEIYQSGPTSGQIWFGREDHVLYIGVGDGSRARRKRFDRGSHNGKVLRINVDIDSVRDGNVPYKIPGDNPFADQPSTLLPEVFAYGLQNPWRCSEERRETKKGTAQTRIICVDVGPKFSDINIIQKGGMFGWLDEAFSPCHDLDSCRNATNTKLKSEFKLPICRYMGIAVGGFFYAPWNAYLFADYMRGSLHYLKPSHAATGNAWLRGHVEVLHNASYCGVDHRTLLHQTVLNLLQITADKSYILTISAAQTSDEPNGHLYRISSPNLSALVKTVRSQAVALQSLFDHWLLALICTATILTSRTSRIL